MKKWLAILPNTVYSIGNRIHLLKLSESKETESGGNSGESRPERVPKVQGE